MDKKSFAHKNQTGRSQCNFYKRTILWTFSAFLGWLKAAVQPPTIRSLGQHSASVSLVCWCPSPSHGTAGVSGKSVLTPAVQHGGFLVIPTSVTEITCKCWWMSSHGLAACGIARCHPGWWIHIWFSPRDVFLRKMKKNLPLPLTGSKWCLCENDNFCIL